MTRGMSVDMAVVDEVQPMPYLSTRDGKAITLAAALQAHEDAQREHRQNEALRRLLAAERGRRLEASVPRRNYVAEYRARQVILDQLDRLGLPISPAGYRWRQ